MFALNVLSSRGATGSPTVIGPEASIQLPSTALWNGIINLQPGNNEVVTLNPPIFSWFYAPGDPAKSAYDKNVYQYVFQASYQSDFSSLIFDIKTLSCCYNFLAPFTNSPVYWRVAYVTTNLLTITNAWINNSFTIDPGAKVWDRHYLADVNYMAQKTVHPYLWFNSSNQAAMGLWFITNNPARWKAITNLAQTGMNQSWWTAKTWGTNVLADEGDRGTYISGVAFVWMMTGDGHWTNGLINTYSNLVTYHQSAQRWQFDYSQGNGEGMLRAIIFGYDWLYPMLSTQEKTNAISALHKVVRANLYNVFWFFNPTMQTDPTGEYPGPYQVPYQMASKFWASHPKAYAQYSWISCLPIINDDPDARLLSDLYINYMIGRMTPYGTEAINRGRSYGWRDTFSHGTADMTLFLNSIFPEMTLTNNPALPRLADWWLRMIPPGYIAPSDAWGDYTSYPVRDWWHRPSIGRDLAQVSGNGAVVSAINQTVMLYGVYSGSDSYWDSWTSEFYVPTPSPTKSTTLAAVFPTAGWVVASQYPPGTAASFSNGVSFNFAARPMGSDLDHTRLNDLDIEIFAYGASVTANQGGSGYAARPTFLCNSILVNGTDQVQTAYGPRVPVYGKIIAFTNASDFTYCAGDATQCYPHDLFPPDPGGGNNNPVGFFLPEVNHNFAMPYVSKVQRHILFPHRKYFVIYDDLATTNNATFQWIWHTFGTSVMKGGGSFDYTVRPYLPDWKYPWTNITVHVFQVVNPSLLAVTNRQGANVYINPYTGMDLSGYMTYEGGIPMTNAVWVTNITPTNQFHFMTVIYPVKPGDADPTITRVDDYTVHVVQGANDDVISVDPTTSPPTFSLNLTGPTFIPGQLSPPQDLRVAPPP